MKIHRLQKKILQRYRTTKGNLSHLQLQIAYAFSDANKDEVRFPPGGKTVHLVLQIQINGIFQGVSIAYTYK